MPPSAYERVIDALLEDLDDRQGFDLCSIDAVTMIELKSTWIAIISRYLAPREGDDADAD